MIIVTSAVKNGGTIKTRVFTGTDGTELAVACLQELIAFLNQQGAITEDDLRYLQCQFRPQHPRTTEVWLDGAFIKVHVEMLII